MGMSKTGYITARVEPKLKARAGRVLTKIGVSTSDAITMFLRQVVLHQGMPFDVRVPNSESRKAIAELEAGRGERFEGTTQEFFDQALGRRQKRGV
jgi:DNA-damage-inducible protein J